MLNTHVSALINDLMKQCIILKDWLQEEVYNFE